MKEKNMAEGEEMNKYISLVSDVMDIHKENIWIDYYRDSIP